jgi:hypothetical protein
VVEINDTWLNNLTRRSTGSFPWRHGALMAHGDFVGFLGDDDEFLDHHVRVSVKTMDVEETDFSVCQVDFYGHGNYVLTIGHPLLGLGHMDATGVMCRREALRTANWDTPPLEEPDANAGDWRMVRDWRAAGLKGSFIGAVGGRHHDGWLTGYPS